MAFVGRATKTSIFDQPSLLALTKAQTDCSHINDTLLEEREDKIHGQVDQDFRKYLGKGAPSPANNRSLQTQESFLPDQSGLNLTIGSFNKENLTIVSFNKEKSKKSTATKIKSKKKVQLKRGSSLESLQLNNEMMKCIELERKNRKMLNQKMYCKNSTSSPFMQNPIIRNKKKLLTPGPGSYNPLPLHSKPVGGKINPLKDLSTNLVKAKESEVEEEVEGEQQEFIFPVKYDKMNSSNFKTVSKMVGYSNKLLLSKLFSKRNPTQENCTENDEEYETVQERYPSPTSYVVTQNEETDKENKSPFNSSSPRFPIIQPSSVSPASYRSLDYPDSSMHTPAVTSKINRFPDPKILNQRLQYSSTVDSLIKLVKNRKLEKFAFNSGIFRGDKIIEDPREYHSSCEMSLKGPQWSQSVQQRRVFEAANENPAPGLYSDKSGLERLCHSFSKSPRTDGSCFKIVEKVEKQKAEDFLLGFGNQTDHESLKALRRGAKIHKKIMEKSEGEKKGQKKGENYVDAVYNVPMEWQKKSFNKLFTKMLLSTPNNPVYNQF